MPIRGILNAWTVSCLVLVLAGVTFLVLYLGGWWIFADSTNREAQVRQSSFAYQQGYISDVNNEVATLGTLSTELTGNTDAAQVQALRAQRHSVLVQTCNDAAKITAPTPGIADFQTNNCLDGSASPQSQYAS